MPAPPSDSTAPRPAVPGPVGGYRNAPVTAPGFDSAVPKTPGGPPALSGFVLVDADKLDKAVNVANEAASEAHRAERWMDAALGRSGPEPWGDDPSLGQSFGSVFAEPRQTLVHAIETLPPVLHGLVNQLQQTSSAFAAANDEAAAAVQSCAFTHAAET